MIYQRQDLKKLLESKGGIVQKGCTKKTDYVIVGSMKTASWAHANYGRKIETAMKYKTPIIPEKAFRAITKL